MGWTTLQLFRDWSGWVTQVHPIFWMLLTKMEKSEHQFLLWKSWMKLSSRSFITTKFLSRSQTLPFLSQSPVVSIGKWWFWMSQWGASIWLIQQQATQSLILGPAISTSTLISTTQLFLSSSCSGAFLWEGFHTAPAIFKTGRPSPSAFKEFNCSLAQISINTRFLLGSAPSYSEASVEYHKFC